MQSFNLARENRFGAFHSHWNPLENELNKKWDKKQEMKNQQQQKWVENFMVTQLAVPELPVAYVQSKMRCLRKFLVDSSRFVHKILKQK